MDDILLFILGLGIGFTLGKMISDAINAMSFREILKDLDISQERLEQLRDELNHPQSAETDPTDVEIIIEQHGGQLYAYRKSDDTFLAQGHDREELVRRLEGEMPRGSRMIVRDRDSAALIKNG
jgi:hypothetical protein